MPDRTIRERHRRSVSLDRVSAEADRLFTRLITYADDYGRFPADPELMLAGCFPRAVSRFTPQEIVSWYGELQREEMIETWWFEGQFYGRLINFEKDQGKPRAKKSKYPDPYSGKKVIDVAIMLTPADKCSQMKTSADNSPRSTIYDLDLRSSDLDPRSRSRDLDPFPRETPVCSGPPVPQIGEDRSENPATLKSGAQPRAEQPVPAAKTIAAEQSFNLHTAIQTLVAGSKMENVVGPGERKRQLKLADAARRARPP